MDSGRFAEAEKLLSSNMKWCGDQCYLFHFFLGNALYMEGKKEEALLQFEKAVELRPSFMDALVNSARVSFDLKMFEKASYYFQRAYSVSKKPLYLYLSSMSDIYAKRYSVAYVKLRGLLTKFGVPKDRWLDAFAYSAHCLGEEKDAVDFLENLPKKSPHVWKVLARLCMQDGRYREALKFYKVYSYFVPSMGREDMEALAGLYAVEGIFLEAARLYERLGLYKKAGVSYLSSHEHRKAVLAFKRCAGKDPECLFLMGNAYYEVRRYKKALECYERSAKKGYKRGSSYLMAGYCELSMGKGERALFFFKRALGFKDTREKALDAIKLLKGRELSGENSS